VSGQTASPKPPVLTAEQKEKLEERNQLVAQINELQRNSKFDAAALLLHKAIELEKGLFGPNHWRVTNARWTLRDLEMLGRLAPAERAEVDLAKRLINQGYALYAKAKYLEAQKLFEKAIDIRRKLLGEEHPQTAASYDYLAVVLSAQRQYPAAETLCHKALEIRKKVLGEEHPETARSYGGLARNLTFQGKYKAAETNDRKALAIFRKILGEDHADTATSYNNLAEDVGRQGQYAAAETLHRQALAIRQKVLGEEQLETAESYSKLAQYLVKQGRYAAAESLDRQALGIYLKVRGEEHPRTARMYSQLAAGLTLQGRYAEAEAPYRQALAISRKVLGEDRAETATTYSNLALNLSKQGQHSLAETLDRQALDINRKVLGEEHPHTATSYNNLATDLMAQGRYPAAEALCRQALTISRKVLGDEHAETAASYNNLAEVLHRQGKFAAAEKLRRQALAVGLKVLGEEHPDTATMYDNLGADLMAHGQYGAAEALHRQALAINRKLLGEAHPDTAINYYSLAVGCYARGQYHAAEGLALATAKSFELARLHASFSGLGRSGFAAEHSPLSFLAALLARNGKPGDAWKYFEDELGRGLFDDLSARHARPLVPGERQTADRLQGQLAVLDQRLLNLARGKGQDNVEAGKLRQQRDQLVLQLLHFQALMNQRHGPAAGQVYPLSQIQALLAADDALIGWVDWHDESQAKFKDPNGEHWGVVVRHTGLPAWVKLQPAHEGVWTDKDKAVVRNALKAILDLQADPAPDVKALWRQRLRPLMSHLEGVTHLIVLPSRAMRSIPVEALTDCFRVSYAPSATIYAWLERKRKPLPPGTADLLALGDPEFTPEQVKLRSAAKDDALARLLRAEQLKPLPGTRGEVEAIARLFSERSGQVVKLLGRDARGGNLEQLAQGPGLSRFRYLHLATHGFADQRGGMNSYLALTPEDPALATHGKLSAGHMLRTWKLDADLVVLSACQTALGEHQGGEGYVGFAQALLLAGARSLVLSQWPVDDRAATLLMHRFYQNLLGNRRDLKSPLPKVDALAEAKHWLKRLSREEVIQGLRELGVPADAAWVEQQPERPFAHPYYWAAFILIGDPGLAAR
jgi:CHAT domain-containing protein